MLRILKRPLTAAYFSHFAFHCVSLLAIDDIYAIVRSIISNYTVYLLM